MTSDITLMRRVPAVLFPQDVRFICEKLGSYMIFPATLLDAHNTGRQG